MNIIFTYIFLFIHLCNAFTISYIYNNKITTLQYNKPLLAMSYFYLKDYDETLNRIPSFQTNLIINNWMNYVNNDSIINYPDYMKTSIYDFKIFLAINNNNTNTIFFTWCPQKSIKDNYVIYLIGGIINDNILEIHRIAQNPYAKNMLIIDSKILYNELYEYIEQCNNIDNISYTILHKYDIRYKLSWKF